MRTSIRRIDDSIIEATFVDNKILRELYKANSESLYELFHFDIHKRVEYLQDHKELADHHEMLSNFLDMFDEVFNRWRGYLDGLGFIPKNLASLVDLLSLGWWDSSYCNDPRGKLSPFGPWLAGLGEALGGSRIGVLHAFEQQLTHPLKDDLVKAQELANELYNYFLKFIRDNGIESLKSDYEHPPLIQLYNDGAACYLKDLPVPTIIAMNKAKAHDFSGFSALPHEFGHDMSGTFKNASLVEDIIANVRDLNLPYSYFWQMWIEECFADAVGVMAIGEGEIFSLANLFSKYYTNIIFADEQENRPDEHPNRHIRVLLCIEVGRVLGLDENILDETEKQWNDFSEKINHKYPSDQIYDQFNDKLYPMDDFIASIKPVANALLNGTYGSINGKKPRDILSGFQSELADELSRSITERPWL
jgi:hypothetical protein